MLVTELDAEPQCDDDGDGDDDEKNQRVRL